MAKRLMNQVPIQIVFIHSHMNLLIPWMSVLSLRPKHSSRRWCIQTSVLDTDIAFSMYMTEGENKHIYKDMWKVGEDFKDIK